MNLKCLVSRPTLVVAALALATTGASAQGVDAAIDTFFKDHLGWFATLIFTPVPIAGTEFPLIAGWLMLAALIFTVYFGFLQFRKVKRLIDIVSGKYSDPNLKEPGEISHFQALATALSGTVGLGNIAVARPASAR